MSDHLYNSSGHLKIDHITRALNKARLTGDIHGVPSAKFGRFAKAFEEEAVSHQSRVGHNITDHEAQFLLKQIMKNEHDNISNRELKSIENVIINKDFNT